MKVWVWNEADQKWVITWLQPFDQRHLYNYCGANAICYIHFAAACTCLVEFTPKFKVDWDLHDFSNGSVRKNHPQCSEGNAKFVNEPNIELPANPQSLEVGNSDICEFACSINCSCSAYALSSKGVCSLYFGDILDLQQVRNNGTGADLYIRMSSAKPPGKGNRKGRNVAALPCPQSQL